MYELKKSAKGIKCACCGRKKVLYYDSVSGGTICRYCYSHCESITGIPYCYIERKKIGGYWPDKRSNDFVNRKGVTIVRQRDWV